MFYVNETYAILPQVQFGKWEGLQSSCFRFRLHPAYNTRRCGLNEILMSLRRETPKSLVFFLCTLPGFVPPYVTMLATNVYMYMSEIYLSTGTKKNAHHIKYIYMPQSI